ncbi:unnamed protein product, partial [Rotaria sp. Silwood1]
RIRELRLILENGIITPISNEDINENHNIISFIEHDSGLSENELNQTTGGESNQIILTKFLQPLNSSSDIESGISSSDYSPKNKIFTSSFTLQHQLNSENNDIPTLERISFELNSIALDWRSYHAPFHCTCSLPFDSAQRKYNCWRCGENFCIRCIEHGIRLPGLYSNNLVPVCKTCVRTIKLSPLFVDYIISNKSKYRNQTEIKSSTSIIDQK